MRAFGLLLFISLGFLALTLVSMRRRVLREHTAVLWVLVALAMIGLTCTLPFDLLDHLAHSLGIVYGSDLVFLLAIVFLMVLVFQLSLVVAKLTVRTTRLAQEIGLLKVHSRDYVVETPEAGRGAGSPVARSSSGD